LLPISVKFHLPIWVVIILLAAGCQQSNVATAEPQATIRVELSSTLQYLTPAIQACSLHGNGLHIIMEEKPASMMGKTGADVSLRWGDAEINPALRVFRLGSDRLVFAAHKENPLKELTAKQASLLSKGGISNWGEILDQFCPKCSASDIFRNQPLEPWQYTSAEDITTEIAKIPSLNQTAAMNRIWVAPNVPAMAEAIASNTAAIGWLPARWLNENLKELALIDANPEVLAIPVLAMTPNEPTPVISEWLTCLQSTYNN
jgi:hypothetical protein